MISQSRLLGRIANQVGSSRAVYWIALAAILFVLMAAGSATPAQAQGSCFIYYSGRLSLYFSRGSFLSGEYQGYNSSDCTNPYDNKHSTSGGGWVRVDSRDEAKRICDSRSGYTDTNPSRANNEGGVFYRCGKGSGKDDDSKSTKNGSSGSSSNSRKGRSAGASPSATPPPGPPTGITIQETGLKVSATLGLESGIQFQRLDAGGIGIQSVIDMGLLDAVDVWGTIGGKYEVCFPQAGAIIFLDASSSPRASSSIAYFTRDGYTCAEESRAGTIVLVASSSSAASPSSAASASPVPSSRASTEMSSPLANCQVTTLYNLNLRNAPNGNVIHAVIPYQTTLPATARTSGWFKVTYDGREGWASGRYLATYGACSIGSIT